MNGEIPSVPITTLAGVASLTDLLPELPLPAPLPHVLNNRSLLYHPKVADDAKKIIATRDEKLVSQLVHALRQTNTDNIELKDNLASDAIEGEIPDLLKAILAQDSRVFKGGPVYNTAHSGPMPMSGNQYPYPPNQNQQPSPYQAGQISPCPPGSPARFPPSQVSPSRHLGQGNFHNSQPGSFPSSNNYQQQFLSFASGNGSHQAGDGPTVNGGPGPHSSGVPPKNKPQKTATASSPAQAASHYPQPPPSEPATEDAAPLHGRSSSQGDMHTDDRQGAAKKNKEPVVMLKPLSSEDISKASRKDSSSASSSKSSSHKSLAKDPSKFMMMPSVKLTKLDINDPYGHYTIKASKDNRLTLKLSKAKLSEERRGSKRPHEDDDGDVEYQPSMYEMYGDFGASLSERVKRRRGKKTPDDEDDEEEEEEERTITIHDDAPRRRKEKKHRNKRPAEPSMSVEELMETGTFKRFSSAIDQVLECAEDVDFSSLNADDDTDGSDAFISKALLTDLCTEAAKLKAMGVTNQVPYEKLVKLLALLQFNIKDGCKILPALNPDDGRHEEELWRELTFERVVNAIDASLTALYIMTSPNMPKQVYLEEVIERLVFMTKIQLQNSIFPEFDPVYRVDSSNKFGYLSSVKAKRSKSHGSKHKTTIQIYNKLSEVVGVFSELIDVQELTDTIILQTSTLAVSPFFVENISELQLNALKLVTSIFAKYEKHRQLILEDILSSLARLPTSKKNLRNYRLNAEEQIQMVTALALQLIQCVVRLPKPVEASKQGDPHYEEEDHGSDQVDKEVVIVTSYETAMRTAHNFLSVFLRKCSSKGEEDYRPLFENFVYDLLATVNKPEWPAAELILSLLGRLLVQQFSNKSVDMSLRVASLDYLGIVASRLRKDAVSSRLDEDTIRNIIEQINDSDSETEEGESSKKPNVANEEDKSQHLQKSLLDYLVYNAENDPALAFARQFYIGQWYRDCTAEVEKINKVQNTKNTKDPDEIAEELERQQAVLQNADKRKIFLMLQVNVKTGAFSNYKPSPSKLDYDHALLVTRYLASNRPFSQSFDIYLTQILKVLCETAVAVRTKAMKCLSAVVEADPAILARADMQKGVHGRFLDQSTSVREAAIELVGKFILIRPELTTQYYDMLSDRILDTGISVRKRVIKIFRDICMEQPDFEKIPEMCVKMIRRVNDEEGIKKLVNETFQSMWFSPSKDSRDSAKLLRRVMNITDVVAACRDTGYDWFEQLLENLFRKEEDTSQKPVEKACSQIVDCLVENVLSLEERAAESEAGKQTSSSRLIACLATLYLFCKVKPELLVKHTPTIQPYLNIRCSTQGDFLVLHNVARILEVAVPLMDHPSESFLAQLEEDMMKLILKHGMMVLQSCVSCLGAIVNRVTHNYKLVRDCFQKFFGVLSKLMAEHKRDQRSPTLVSSRPTLLRSLFTVGLLCKQFDFDSEDFGEKKMVPVNNHEMPEEGQSSQAFAKVSIRDRVFDVYMYFVKHEDEEVKHKALSGLGFLCTRHYNYMLSKELRDLYHEYLGDSEASIKMRCQVLKNLQTYLTDEEMKMMKADAEWRKKHEHDKEDLKEMNDVQSGMASTVIQIYIKQVLESFLHSHGNVRLSALSVIVLILRQGLVHPVQCVPYLICMGTDCDSQVRLKADQQVQEIDKKYPGFIQMKAMAGIKMSFKLQMLLQMDVLEPVRGIRTEDNPIALNHFIYSLVRGNRGNRRAILSSMLNMFDDTAKTPLAELLYMADNLAFFPFMVQDEPLFLIHQIDILVSVSGSNLLQSYKEVFYPSLKENLEGEGQPGLVRPKIFDDEDDDVESLLSKTPEDVSQLQDLHLLTQGCIILLVLKQHLKEMYGFTDKKIHLYSPTEQAKIHDKPFGKKHEVKFHPKYAIDLLKSGPQPSFVDENTKRQLIQDYIDFKILMLSIDPADEDDDDDETLNRSAGNATPVAAGARTPIGAGASIGVDGEASNISLPGQDGEGPPLIDPTTGEIVQTPTAAAPPPQEQVQVQTPGQKPSSKYAIYYTQTQAYQRLIGSSASTGSSSERKRGRSSQSKPRTPSIKTPKPKKKKKRRRISDTESEDDSGEDPDFAIH